MAKNTLNIKNFQEQFVFALEKLTFQTQSPSAYILILIFSYTQIISLAANYNTAKINDEALDYIISLINVCSFYWNFVFYIVHNWDCFFEGFRIGYFDSDSLFFFCSDNDWNSLLYNPYNFCFIQVKWLIRIQIIVYRNL